MNETNLTQHGRSTDVNASEIFFSEGYEENFKKREFIENDVLLSQFMLCQNINKYNNGLCKSSFSYKGVEI